MTEAGHAGCPQCQANNGEKVRFTWRAGALGTRILGVVRCANCGGIYYRKTGRSASAGLWAWFAGNVFFAAALGIVLFMYLSGRW